MVYKPLLSPHPIAYLLHLIIQHLKVKLTFCHLLLFLTQLLLLEHLLQDLLPQLLHRLELILRVHLLLHPIDQCAPPGAACLEVLGLLGFELFLVDAVDVVFEPFVARKR